MKLDSSISAVVTGGASGLGEATARKLAGYGVKVAIFDLNAEKGEALAERDRRRVLPRQRHLEARSTPPSPRRARRSARSAFWSIAPAPALASKPPAGTGDGEIKPIPPEISSASSKST